MFKRWISAILAVLMIAALLASCGIAVPEETTGNDETGSADTEGETGTETEWETDMKKRYRPEPIDLKTLTQTGSRSQRWLSVPGSRIVLNPYSISVDTRTTESDFSDRPTLPLNIGFLTPYTTSDWGEWLEDLVTLYEPGDAEANVELLAEANLEDRRGWTYSGESYTDLSIEDGLLSLTVRSGANVPWQFAAYPIDIDLSEDPVLTVRIVSSEGVWALKVCETGKEDITLISDTSKTGQFSVSLTEALGRKDRFKGTVKIYEVGYDQTVTVDRLDIQKVETKSFPASRYKTGWTPSALTFEGSYPGGLKISGTDLFADSYTVLRTVRAESDGDLLIGIRIPAQITMDAAGGIHMGYDRYSAVLYADTPVKPRFYDGMLEMMADYGGNARPYTRAAYAAYTLSGMKAGDTVTLSIAIGSDAVGDEKLTACAREGLATGSEKARQYWDGYWTDYLDLVPRPDNFEFSKISSQGLSAAKVRQQYYIAWIFLAQNILEPNPELDYPYYQVCCGKPSMWASGAHESAYSASWESFFGIQLLGYVMPDIAWSALEGLISLVDETGLLGGESLPSEKAHSAYLLYMVTEDKEKLASLYDGIARYLDWRIENPRWIYKEHNDIDSADADFVSSALVDIQYMIRIADILLKDEDVAAWERKHAALLENYYKWNFDDDLNVFQYCNKKTLARSPGCTIWTTKGLLVDGLDWDHTQALIRRFMTQYNPAKTLAGLTGVKYPEISQAALGLYQVQETEKALVLAEMCAREVTRFGMFAENYDYGDTPVGSGVRPAMFGCAMMIDGILMMNGFSYATTEVVDMGRTNVGVSNIRIGQLDYKIVNGELIEVEP